MIRTADPNRILAALVEARALLRNESGIDLHEGHKDERRVGSSDSRSRPVGDCAGLEASGPGRTVGGVGVQAQTRRFGSARIHKASSAESILRHCLRQRGYTSRWRRGELTQRQTFALLNDIRQYGRAWMHHEASALIDHYGHLVERGLASGVVSHVGRFFRRARSFIHEAILAGAMALYGPTEIDADDLREVEHQAEEQVRYLDRFHNEVKVLPPPELAAPEPPGTPLIVLDPSAKAALQPMTAKQFEARAEQYGDATWGAAQEVQRKRMIRGGLYTEEKRVHGKLVDDMCETCSAAVAAGWQPIGTLPRIGQSECMGSCHCYFVWKDAAGNTATSVRKFKLHKGIKRVPPIHVSTVPVQEPVHEPTEPVPVQEPVHEPTEPVPVQAKPKIKVPQPPPVPKVEVPAVPKVEVPPVHVPPVPKVQVPKVPSIGKPEPKDEPVKVAPMDILEYSDKAPKFLAGPWVDADGNAILYYSTADYDDS